MPARQPPVAGPSRTRAAVSNRSRTHQNVDERSAGARRFKDLLDAYSDGLGHLTESDFALVRQAAAMTLRAEQLQAAMANGDPIDPDILIRLSGEIRRSLGAISAKRHERKPAGQTLQDYWASKDKNDEEAETEE